jgi:hypothetical protein
MPFRLRHGNWGGANQWGQSAYHGRRLYMAKLSQMVGALLPPLFLFAAGAVGTAALGAAGKMETITVDKICLKPERVIGRTVEVRGRFQGWMASDCYFPEPARTTPITRSDWLVRTGASCLYVTGGMPSGLSPANPGDIGRSIAVSTTVLRDSDGKLYLSFIKVLLR